MSYSLNEGDQFDIFYPVLGGGREFHHKITVRCVSEGQQMEIDFMESSAHDHVYNKVIRIHSLKDEFSIFAEVALAHEFFGYRSKAPY